MIADNLAGAIAAYHALEGRLPERDAVAAACRAQAGLVGRRERVDGRVPILYDVGHNVEAVERLVDALRARPARGETHMVIGMLSDKPVEAVAERLSSLAHRLYYVGLADANGRGLDASTLARRFGIEGSHHVDPAAGLAAARTAAVPGDRIVVCGSFHTVAGARRPPPA